MCNYGTIEGVLFKPLERYDDPRGWLIEIFRHDEMNENTYPQMAYISQTLPGVARGPHEHVDQSDYFAFLGPGDLKLYLWDNRSASATHGVRHTSVVGQSNPQAVLIPPGVVHAYKNVGEGPAWVINLPNRLYRGPGRQQDVDEIRHEDVADSPYVLD